jgi:hypothetical protein
MSGFGYSDWSYDPFEKMVIFPPDPLLVDVAAGGGGGGSDKRGGGGGGWGSNAEAEMVCGVSSTVLC